MIININGLNELSEGVGKLLRGASKITMMHEEKIVESSKKIRGDKKVKNKTEVVETPVEARRLARLKNAQLNKPMNESQTPKEELLQAKETLVKDLVGSMIKDLLQGKY